MSAIAEISKAVDMKADELVLANGGSFADFCKVALMLDDARWEAENAPISVRIHDDARGDVATIRPGH